MLLAGRGLLARLFRPMFRLIDAKLAHVSAGLPVRPRLRHGDRGRACSAFRRPRRRKALSIWSILVFPALFTAGMALIDTTDGMLMLGAYGWAFLKPIRKLYYNMTITRVSVVVAVLVGGIEALGARRRPIGAHDGGGFWERDRRAQRQFRLQSAI